jgi:uncharacterized membrane protein YdbT with pleckstrin-like domain
MADIYISDLKKEKTEKKRKKVPSKKKKRVEKKAVRFEKKNLFGAFYENPQGVDFETRFPEEKVVLVLRRHPITNIRWVLIAILMIFAPILLSFFPLLEFLPGNFQFITILGWYLITTAFVLQNFLTWFFNVDVVTDERIVDIEFYNLIYKQVSDAQTNRIQDITYKMGGALRNIFNFGDVYVQTAGEVPNFEFLAVPNPERVVEVLQQQRIEEEKEKLEGRVR